MLLFTHFVGRVYDRVLCYARTTESTRLCQYCVSICAFSPGSKYLCTSTSYVSKRQRHTSAYVSIRQHMSAHVAFVPVKQVRRRACGFRRAGSRRAYVIRPHTSAYVSIRQLKQVGHLACGFRRAGSLRGCVRRTESTRSRAARAPAAVLYSKRQHTSAYAVLYGIRQQTSAYV